MVERTKDPTKLPVQFNVLIPWDFREFLREVANRRNVSMNSLAKDALMEKYGTEFARSQARAPR